MSFEYPYILFLLALLPLAWFWLGGKEVSLERWFAPELYKKMVLPGGGLSKRFRRALLFGALAFGILALARPVIDKGEIRIRQEARDLVVAFDISRSMFANDLYPNRFELAKRKFRDFLEAMNGTRIAVIGFSSRAFLVAPLTDDSESLRYLVDHMGPGYVSLRGTDMFAPLEAAQNLLSEKENKALLIFTDGGDENDFSKEIDYAKKHNIKVFVYAVGTEKGGVMRLENGGVVRDAKGEVVIARLNPAIRKLAEETGGIYTPFSLRSNDMRMLAEQIRKRLEVSGAKDESIRDREELFYYPLAVAVILFAVAFVSLPKRGQFKMGERK